MAAPYKKVQIQKYPLPPGQTDESRYWKRFKTSQTYKEVASVTSIHFSPTHQHDFAVTASTRIQIYSSINGVKKTISRFKDTVYSGHIRNDGKLLVAGDATGLIQIFDLSSRAILRTIREHKNPVQVTKFSPVNTQILSCSDDKTVRVWDIPTQECDYARAGLFSENNRNLLLSGSYDETVKLWDIRIKECALTMKHEYPVEDVLMFPGDGVIISAGGPYFKVWDLLMGGRLIQTVSNHQKTITSLCFDSQRTRLFTGSLDQHVKVYDVQDYKVIYNFKHPAPVLTVACSSDDTHLAVGMVQGLLSVHKRKSTSEQSNLLTQHNNKKIRGGTYKYYVRGAQYRGEEEDYIIESRRNKHIALYDRYLRKFQYGNALDAALRPGTRAIVTVSLLYELIHRGGLRQALKGRDDVSLEPILNFLLKNINNMRYASLLVDVGETTLDMYASVLSQSPIIEKLISKLRTKVQQEVKIQTELSKVLGSLQMIMSKGIINKRAPDDIDMQNEI